MKLLSAPFERMSMRLRRLFWREDGTATIEFALMFPAVITIFVMAMETGVIQIRQVMLDRALDLTVRELRLGRLGGTPTQEDVFDRVCANAFLIPNCRENLSMELTPIALDDWERPQTAINCVDHITQISPVNPFTQAGQMRPTLVRACLMVDMMFPTSRFGLQMAVDPQGGYRMMSYSFYINEPEV